MTRISCLIPLPVRIRRNFPLHVRRQRHRSKLLKQRKRVARRLRPHPPHAIWFAVDQREMQSVRHARRIMAERNQHDSLARLQVAARPPDQPPIAALGLSEIQPLPFAAGVRSPANQPGRQHARVIEHQTIARPQQVSKLANPAMLNRTRLPIKHQQPRSIPLRQRLFGDQLFRKLVVIQRHVVERAVGVGWD